MIAMFSVAVCCSVELYSRLAHKLTPHCDFLVSNPPYVTRDEMKSLQPEIARYNTQLFTFNITEFCTLSKYVRSVSPFFMIASY